MFDYLTPAEPVTLSNSPLQTVLMQVKFGSRATLSTHAGANAFYDQLADIYPRLLSEQQTVITASPEGLTTTTVPQWRLTDIGEHQSCVIGAEALTVETKSYNGWSPFRERIAGALSALEAVAAPRVRERIGLRYVNQIEPDETDSLHGCIRPELLGAAGIDTWRPGLRVAAGQVILQDQGTTLSIRHGWGIPSAPNGATTGNFLLDFDLFNEEPKEFEVSSLLDYLDELNDAVYRLFCEIVPVGYRKTLE